MFAVIFEVQPKRERFDDYLELAKFLKPKLTAIEGFIDNERFKSKRTDGRLLSLSTWRDEKAVVRWRTQGDHHAVQEKGRLEIFQNYHLRVGEVTDDTDPPPGIALLQQRFDETAKVHAKAASITELSMHGGNLANVDPERPSALFGLDPGTNGLIDYEVFESIYSQGKLLLLITWADGDAAAAWMPNAPPAADALRHRRVRVIRDYGMSDRYAAPQYFPDSSARTASPENKAPAGEDKRAPAKPAH
jgi:heme-degrading monooxygenase HmoA